MTITPNQITAARIIAVPLISLLLCVDGKIAATLAFVLFMLAALSDWFDGYLARQSGNTTLLGRVFDSIADKLLISSVLLALAYNGRLGTGLIIPALAIIMREIFVAGLREYAALKKQRMDEDTDTENKESDVPLPSSQLGKVKAALQMLALALLIPAPYVHSLLLTILGAAGLWIAAGLSLYTGWEYWKTTRFNVV